MLEEEKKSAHRSSKVSKDTSEFPPILNVHHAPEAVEEVSLIGFNITIHRSLKLFYQGVITQKVMR